MVEIPLTLLLDSSIPTVSLLRLILGIQTSKTSVFQLFFLITVPIGLWNLLVKLYECMLQPLLHRLANVVYKNPDDLTPMIVAWRNVTSYTDGFSITAGWTEVCIVCNRATCGYETYTGTLIIHIQQFIYPWDWIEAINQTCTDINLHYSLVSKVHDVIAFILDLMSPLS